MSWKAGLAKRIITPETPVWLAGYGEKRLGKNIIHHLWMKALALEDENGERAVLFTSDNQGFPKSMYDNVTTQLKQTLNLTSSQVMLTYSHNHCGPRLREDLVDYYPIEEGQIKLVEEYTALMEKAIVDLIRNSFEKLEPVTLATGNGITRFAVNRRENTEEDVDDKLSRNIPLNGAVDHDVPVLSVRSNNNDLLAVVFGYACHATTLAFEQWCGDYPGFAQLAIEKAHPGTMAMFFPGCGADQNPIPRRDLLFCDTYGSMLASAVEEVLRQPMRSVSSDLRTAFEFSDLAYLKQVTKEDCLEAIQGDNIVRARWAARMLGKINAGEELSTSFPYPIQVWKLGEEMLIIALGGEAVVDYSLKFKKHFGEGTWVCGYSSDLIAYIPSLRVYNEGGYEGGAHIQEYGYHPAERWGDDVEDRITKTVEKLVDELDWRP